MINSQPPSDSPDGPTVAELQSTLDGVMETLIALTSAIASLSSRIDRVERRADPFQRIG